MRSISLAEIQTQPILYQEMKAVLEEGRLVCFPTPSGYKLGADLSSPAAITSMLQAKRRVKNAPALVFVPDTSWVPKVAAHVSNEARLLMEAFWPGRLTLLFEANEELPPKVRKPLTKAKGWLGVRVPCDEVSRDVVNAFGRPILVSSANLANKHKHGSSSVAQVRKNFGRTVELLIDAGDISVGPESTLVDLTNGVPSVVRSGAVSMEEIQDALVS